MKLFRIALIAVSCSLGGSALADDGPAPVKGEHPCKKLEAACSAAGFAKGQRRAGKGLFENCVKPLLEGSVVAGVQVDDTDVKACAAARAKHAHEHGSPPPAP